MPTAAEKRKTGTKDSGSTGENTDLNCDYIVDGDKAGIKARNGKARRPAAPKPSTTQNTSAVSGRIKSSSSVGGSGGEGGGGQGGTLSLAIAQDAMQPLHSVGRKGFQCIVLAAVLAAVLAMAMMAGGGNRAIRQHFGGEGGSESSGQDMAATLQRREVALNVTLKRAFGDSGSRSNTADATPHEAAVQIAREIVREVLLRRERQMLHNTIKRAVTLHFAGDLASQENHDRNLDNFNRMSGAVEHFVLSEPSSQALHLGRATSDWQSARTRVAEHLLKHPRSAIILHDADKAPAEQLYDLEDAFETPHLQHQGVNVDSTGAVFIIRTSLGAALSAHVCNDLCTYAHRSPLVYCVLDDFSCARGGICAIKNGTSRRISCISRSSLRVTVLGHSHQKTHFFELKPDQCSVHFLVYFPGHSTDEARFLCLLPRHQSPRQTRARTPIFGKSADQRTIRRFFKNQCFFSCFARGRRGYDRHGSMRETPQKTALRLELGTSVGGRQPPRVTRKRAIQCSLSALLLRVFLFLTLATALTHTRPLTR